MNAKRQARTDVVAVAVVHLRDPVLAHVGLDGASGAVPLLEGGAGKRGGEGGGAADAVDMLGDRAIVDDRVEAVANDGVRVTDDPESVGGGKEEESGGCEAGEHRGLAGARGMRARNERGTVRMNVKGGMRKPGREREGGEPTAKGERDEFETAAFLSSYICGVRNAI